MEKLPIKFFAKREGDEMRVEGGGSSKPPKFVLSSEELYEKSVALRSEFVELDEVIAGRLSRSNIPVVTKIRIVEQAKAKSYKKKLRKFFEVGKKNNIIGLLDDSELVVKFDSVEDFRYVTSKLENTEYYNYQISSIETVSIFNPYIETLDIPEDYKLKLLNFDSHIENEYVCNFLEEGLKTLNIEFKKTFYTEYSLIYRLINTSKETIDELLKLDNAGSIFSISPMPKYTVSLDSVSVGMEMITVEPNAEKKYVTVGVLDSGIEPIAQLKNWIVKENYSAYPESMKDKTHGTFVSGIVVYGDRLENQSMTDTGMFKVLDACVYPDTSKEGLTEDQLISNIREAIEMHHENVKIWTLSISVVKEVTDSKFSDFAAALDSMQDEFDVLIIKSAGNTDNFTKGKVNGRIHEGADSVRSLTIGSIAHKNSASSLVPIDDVSPFSRIGRGPAEIIKPDLVHYGGNIDIIAGKYSAIGVNSFGLSGDMNSSVGTSYSTPRVAGLTADLYDAMDEEFDPLTLKALLIHSGKYTENSKIPKNERMKFAGFGKPKTTKEILYNNTNNATLILRDELYKGEYIDIFDFPMPDCMVEDGYYKGNLTITLVYSPILDITQGSEYCQSDLDIKLGTYEDLKERDIQKNNILNRLGRVDSENTLLPKFYSKNKMKRNTSEFSLREHTLIKYRDKYYPVKKYSISLDDATAGNKVKYLDDQRKWYLYLKGIFRDNAEYTSEITGEDLSQEFCLIVTISDPSSTKNVYDGVSQKLDEYNFWNTNIKVKAEVKVTV